jgi:NADH-quinone oxidoreductase subunit L
MFLGAGSVMHGMNDDVDMRRFGGSRKVMKITWVTFAPGLARDPRCAAVLRLLVQGQDHRGRLRRRGHGGPWLLGGAALIGAGVTAFYMSRLFFMTFHGEKRWADDVHPHESPLTMTVPMIVLAVGSAFLGLCPRLQPGSSPTGSSRSSVSTARSTRCCSVPVIMALTLALVAAGAYLAWFATAKDVVPEVAPRGSLLTRAARAGPLPGRRQRRTLHAPRHPPHPRTGLR